jgi:hypothetical protein
MCGTPGAAAGFSSGIAKESRMKSPIRYTPDLEQPEANEAETYAELRDTLRGIEETTAADYGRAVRAVHAKAHALVKGTLTIREDLPPELAQGLFATGGSYAAIARFSTSPGDLLDDSVTAPRGVALKLLGVAGEHVETEEGDTQDFVMVDGPAFAAPTARKFLGNLKLLAATTDKAEGAKKLLSAALRAAEGTLEALGGESALLKNLGGAPSVHPLGETYFTQTACRYGDHVAKLSLQPVSPHLTALTGSHVRVIGRPDALREECNDALLAAPSEWALRVQLCRDPQTMPIEDATVAWDEAESPFVEVARLRLEPQQGWTTGISEAVEDRLRFSPWHCLAAHRPLGTINRARRGAYRMSSDFRAAVNGCPMAPPAPEMVRQPWTAFASAGD